jgi:hypothetical protein
VRQSQHEQGLRDRLHPGADQAQRLPGTYRRKFGTAKAANIAGCAAGRGVVMSRSEERNDKSEHDQGQSHPYTYKGNYCDSNDYRRQGFHGASIGTGLVSRHHKV